MRNVSPIQIKQPTKHASRRTSEAEDGLGEDVAAGEAPAEPREDVGDADHAQLVVVVQGPADLHLDGRHVQGGGEGHHQHQGQPGGQDLGEDAPRHEAEVEEGPRLVERAGRERGGDPPEGAGVGEGVARGGEGREEERDGQRHAPRERERVLHAAGDEEDAGAEGHACVLWEGGQGRGESSADVWRLDPLSMRAFHTRACVSDVPGASLARLCGLESMAHQSAAPSSGASVMKERPALPIKKPRNPK